MLQKATPEGWSGGPVQRLESAEARGHISDKANI